VSERQRIVFLESRADQHLMRVGGLTALERRIRELAKAGAAEAIVAAERIGFSRALPIPVRFVPPGSAAPVEAQRERADIVAGIELADEDARRRAEWKLIRGMNKSYEGPVDALVNWRFSMRITRVLAQASLALTPNHITVTAIAIGLCAALLASTGTYLPVALAGVLLEFNSILDSCDGELARLRFQFSTIGQWLDNVADDIVDNVFLIAVGYGLGGPWLYAGIAAACARWLVAIFTYVDVYRKTGTGNVFAFRWWFEQDKQSADEVYDPKSPLTWLRSLGRRDTYVFLWMIAAVVAVPHAIIVHGVAIAAVNFSLLVVQLTFHAGDEV